jgi:hypothetical protein
VEGYTVFLGQFKNAEFTIFTALPQRTRLKFSLTIVLLGAVGLLASDYLKKILPVQIPDKKPNTVADT